MTSSVTEEGSRKKNKPSSNSHHTEPVPSYLKMLSFFYCNLNSQVLTQEQVFIY